MTEKLALGIVEAWRHLGCGGPGRASMDVMDDEDAPFMAAEALDAIPDGWAKVDGQWVEMKSAYASLRADLAWCVGWIEQAGHSVPLSAKRAVTGCVCVDGCRGIDGDPPCDMRCGYCIHGED